MNYIFKKESNNIYRLEIPFDDIYTSVFLLNGDEPLLIDSGTTEEDVNQILIPALSAIGFDKDTRGSLLATHHHSDHDGGAEHLLNRFPYVSKLALEDGETLGAVTAYSLFGHTSDSMGYMDTRTNALICGDALQFYGISKYGCSVADVDSYELTLNKIEHLSPTLLLTSHNYVGGSPAASGSAQIAHMLSSARNCWTEIKDFVLSASSESSDPVEIALAYAKKFDRLPPLPKTTVRAILKTIL